MSNEFNSDDGATDDSDNDEQPPLFSLGNLHATPAVLMALSEGSVYKALARHLKGDWGTLSEEDKRANNLALGHGERLLSAYQYDNTRFWIITEADRSSTIMLLPEEY